ncbi:MAG TPA: tetratricopeptide repeat protein [Bryobacteraceae bacterium]|nr:tetratricopeptide repeat protein [Bryobacteraceae bacterium]
MFKAAVAMALLGWALPAQTPAGAASAETPKVDHASSYYHYALAHMYAELASAYGGRGGYLDKAIDNYKAAIKADPGTPMLTEELSELYIASGRLREAQTDAEDALRANPNDIAARRLLARVFTSQIGDQQRQRLDTDMLNKAIEQYQKISQLDPKDVDSLVMLGRLEKVAQNSTEAEKAYKQALAIDPDNEDALTGLAMVYGDLGNTTEAAAILKRMSDKNPSPRSLRALAATYEQMKEYDLAAQALQKALEMNPPDAADLKHALADDQVHAKQYDAAINTYKDLVSDDPTDARAYLEMSRVYRELHDIKNAQAMSDKAKTLDPSDIEIRYNEIGILQSEGKATEALQAMKDLAASTERRTYNQRERALRSDLLQELANMYANIDQIDPAVEALHQAADVNPDEAPKIEAQIMDTYRQGKQFQKAEQEADSALKQFPDDSAVHAGHAMLLADMGKTDQAVAEAKKYLSSGKNSSAGSNKNGKPAASGDRQYYRMLAQIYDKGRKFDDEAKALDQLEKLSQTDEEKMDAWFMRGAMYEKMKKNDQAEAEFRKILQIRPDFAGAENYLGYMLADRGVRLNEALDLITKAVEQDPANGAYLDSLGWVYYKMGRLQEAEENIRKALETTPHDATVRDHLGDVLMKESKVKEAIAQWEMSLSEWNTSSPADLEPAEVAKVKNKLDGAKVRLAREGVK